MATPRCIKFDQKSFVTSRMPLNLPPSIVSKYTPAEISDSDTGTRLSVKIIGIEDEHIAIIVRVDERRNQQNRGGEETNSGHG